MPVTSRRGFLIWLAAALAAGGARAQTTTEDGLKATVVEMVDGAAAAIARVGLTQATRFTPPETWVRPESGLYVFVFDRKGVLRLHPEARVIGASIRATLDAEGTPFIERILAALFEGDGKVWTEYL